MDLYRLGVSHMLVLFLERWETRKKRVWQNLTVVDVHILQHRTEFDVNLALLLLNESRLLLRLFCDRSQFFWVDLHSPLLNSRFYAQI